MVAALGQISITNDCETVLLGFLHEPILSNSLSRMLGASNDTSTAARFIKSYLSTHPSSIILVAILIIFPFLSLCLIGNTYIPGSALILAGTIALITFVLTLMACCSILRRLSSNDVRYSSFALPSPSLISIFQLYGLNVLAFALLYLCLLHDSPGSIRGVVGAEAGLISQLIECLYFSFSVQATAGFGDCHAASTIARAAVSLQLCSGMTVQAILVGKGIDLACLAARSPNSTLPTQSKTLLSP